MLAFFPTMHVEVVFCTYCRKQDQLRKQKGLYRFMSNEKKFRPFGMRDCLAYAAGDLGCNMSFALKSTMALFWTQVMGLSAWYSC